MHFTNAFLLLSLALSASAVSTPHMARNMAHHHVVAARNAPAEEPVVPLVVPRKRSLRKRCKATNGTSTAFPVSSTVLSSTVSVAPTSAPINAGGDPPVFSSAAPSSATPSSAAPSSAAPSSSHSVAPAKPTTSHEPPKTSSEAPAKPTTEAPPPPKTSSEAPEKPSSTHTTAPAPTSGSSSSSSSGGGGDILTETLTGDATFYATGLGACGIVNSDSDDIAAVSHLLFDTFPGYDGGNPNDNPICNKKVTAHYQGKSVTVTITDRCVGCAIGDLDFAPHAFDQLGAEAVGRLHGMTWSFD